MKKKKNGGKNFQFLVDWTWATRKFPCPLENQFEGALLIGEKMKHFEPLRVCFLEVYELTSTNML